MIEICGHIAGEKVRFEFEDTLSCYAVLEKLVDWLDIIERKGCPKNCQRCMRAKFDAIINFR